MTKNERCEIRARAIAFRDASRQPLDGREFNRGMSAAFEIAADSLDRFLGESTVTPLEDVDERVKEAIRETALDELAMDALHGRQLEG